MEFIVYILQSELDGSYYIGYTSDLEKRLSNHNSGKSYNTSRKMPWNVVYSEGFVTKSEALKRESFSRISGIGNFMRS